ncbi:MAG TPA: YlxR family protein [Actinomycetota bacterium]|nr:YlxR family protein [Actinomycetota bacterium]
MAGPRPRRAPVRTCVGCRGTAGKAALIRLVRTPEGVRVDRDGKAPGRGAYLHAERTCCDAAFKRGALARALRTTLSPEEASTLRADIEGASTT